MASAWTGAWAVFSDGYSQIFLLPHKVKLNDRETATMCSVNSGWSSRLIPTLFFADLNDDNRDELNCAVKLWWTAPLLGRQEVQFQTDSAGGANMLSKQRCRLDRPRCVLGLRYPLGGLDDGVQRGCVQSFVFSLCWCVIMSSVHKGNICLQALSSTVLVCLAISIAILFSSAHH